MRNYGRLAERSKAAVLKTVDVQASGGSNPSPSASAAGCGSRRSQKGSLAQVPLPILFRTLPRPSLRYNIEHRNGDDSLRSSIPSSRRSSLRIPRLPPALRAMARGDPKKGAWHKCRSLFCFAPCLALRSATTSRIEMVTTHSVRLFRRSASPVYLRIPAFRQRGIMRTPNGVRIVYAVDRVALSFGGSSVGHLEIVKVEFEFVLRHQAGIAQVAAFVLPFFQAAIIEQL